MKASKPFLLAIAILALALVVVALAGCSEDATQTMAGDTENTTTTTSLVATTATSIATTTTTTQATTTTAPTDTGAAMVGGNAARTGVYPSGGPTERPDLLWKFKTGDWEGTSPVVSDGVVYVAGGFEAGDRRGWSDSPDAYLYALDARSGEERWRFPCPSRYSPGGPAVSEGVVYIAGDNGYLYALDAESRQEIWKFQTGDYFASSPAVADGVVYFGTDGYLYALDAASGQLKWDSLAMDDSFSSPAVSDGVVYFSDSLHALDAQTGQEKWTVDSNRWFEVGPVVSDGVVYFGNERDSGDYLHAFDAQTGEEKWVYKTTGDIRFRSSPAVSGGVVYLLYEAYDWRPETNEANALLVALDAASGRELWQFGVANAVCCIEPWSSPSISGNVVYLHTCSLEGGRLHALDASTGEELWTLLTSPAASAWRGVASSSPAISDGVVYLSTLDGYLYALK